MTDITGQDQQSKDIDAENKRLHQREISDIKKVLSLPEGRRFIWKYLGKAGIFRSSLSQNAMTTQALEGARNLGLELLNEINEVDAHAFARLQEEYLSEQKSKKQEE